MQHFPLQPFQKGRFVVYWQKRKGSDAMDWNLEEALAYYKGQGAPREQSALTALLREVQQELGGSIPQSLLPRIAQAYGIKEALLLALIRRLPSLRISGSHCLELCAGPNCGKAAALAAFAEKNCPKNVMLKKVPCLRLCGKGPNLKWDGVLHHRADPALIEALFREV